QEGQRGLQERIADGIAMVVVQIGGMRGGDIACHRNASGLLARLFELARQISARIARGSAARAAADGARILRFSGDGTARGSGEIVDRAVRARTSIHVRRADTGVRVV